MHEWCVNLPRMHACMSLKSLHVRRIGGKSAGIGGKRRESMGSSPRRKIKLYKLESY